MSIDEKALEAVARIKMAYSDPIPGHWLGDDLETIAAALREREVEVEGETAKRIADFVHDDGSFHLADAIRRGDWKSIPGTEK